jgi:hypothetical protein
MFDTVNFWIPSSCYNESDILESLHKNSVDVKTVYIETKTSSKIIYRGKLKNYEIHINEYGIGLYGSIAKYLFGNDTLKFANRLSQKGS